MGVSTELKKAGRKVEKIITGKEPQVDILDTLKEEHEEVAALLKKLVDGKSSAERKSTFAKIKAALVPHVRAEEKVLYDAILAAGNKEEKQDSEEGYLEHGLADKMLASLGKISNAMSPEYGAAAKVLKELVEHHVEEEESNVWSDARKHFSSKERQAMNVRYLAAKKAVKMPN